MDTAKDKESNEFNKIIVCMKHKPKKSLKLIYEKYGKLIVLAARSICKTDEKTYEAVNAALLKIWKSAESIGTVEDPKVWLWELTKDCAAELTNASEA